MGDTLQVSELTRWLLLGFVSEEDILRDWNYHSSSNYEMLQKYIEGARKYGNGNPEKEIEFLELRLPLVVFSKDSKSDGNKYYMEFYRIENDKLISTIRTPALDRYPSSNYPERLMNHLRAQRFIVKQLE